MEIQLSKKCLHNQPQPNFVVKDPHQLSYRKSRDTLHLKSLFQVYSYQSLERGQWRTVTTVMEETYTSGCVEDTEWAEHLATETKWCYCDQDLCNGYQDQDEPQPYEYQNNFIEGHGLKVCSLLSDTVQKLYKNYLY